jgi:hypothetical protein
MSANEWEVIWKRQELPVGKSVDVTTLLASFETKRRKQARTLWIRDIGEASASFLVAIAFSAIALKTHKAAWLIWLAVALVLGVGAIFIRERIRIRRTKLAADASLIAKLEADISELRHQRRLLSQIGLWYFAPLACAMLLVGGAMMFNASSTGMMILREPFVLGCLIGYAVLCTGLFGFAWRANRRAVEKQIEPRLEELGKLYQHALSQGEDV